MELSTRELASIIIFIAIIALAVVLSKDRQSIWKSLANVVKAFLEWKVWSIILVLLLYSAAVILFAAWIGLWTVELLKDTIIVVLFTGIPLLMASMSTKSGGELIKYLVKEVLGMTAFLVAYLNLAPLALWGELLLQTAVIFLVMCASVGRLDPKTKVVARVCDFLLGLAGIGVLIYTTWFLISNLDGFNWAQEGRIFALSIWLPLLLIPIVYPIGFVAAAETAMLRLRFGSREKKVARRTKFAMVSGFHGRLLFASRFRGDWGAEVAKEQTYRGARRVMKEYREAVRQAATDIRAKRVHAKDMAGVHGVDDEGYWKDRREFQETKTVLISIFFSQMGFARNHKGRFSEDPLSLLLSSELKELPEPQGIEVRTASKRKSWLAYRKTAGGLYLATGGRSDNLNEQWRYAGISAPAGLPGRGEHGWYSAGTEVDQPDEWAKSDYELPDVLSADDLRSRRSGKSINP